MNGLVVLCTFFKLNLNFGADDLSYSQLQVLQGAEHRQWAWDNARLLRVVRQSSAPTRRMRGDSTICTATCGRYASNGTRMTPPSRTTQVPRTSIPRTISRRFPVKRALPVSGEVAAGVANTPSAIRVPGGILEGGIPSRRSDSVCTARRRRNRERHVGDRQMKDGRGRCW